MVAGVPGAASAPAGSIVFVVSEPRTSGTSGVIASEADRGAALSDTTVAVFVIGTPSAEFGRSGETRAVTRSWTCPPLFTRSAVYVTVFAAVSATMEPFVAPAWFWIVALTSSTPSGSGSVIVVGVHGAALGSEHETVTTHSTSSPGSYGPELASCLLIPQSAAAAGSAGTSASGSASAVAPSAAHARRARSDRRSLRRRPDRVPAPVVRSRAIRRPPARTRKDGAVHGTVATTVPHDLAHGAPRAGEICGTENSSPGRPARPIA